jgi:predicted RNA-binding Zn ribbon-like protein
MVTLGAVKVDEFRFFTGSPATDFVGTVGRRLAGGHERLTSTSRLADWLELTGLGSGLPVTEGSLRQARELREAIYRILLARLSKTAVARADAVLVNGHARAGAPIPQLSLDDPFGPSALEPDRIGAALAVIAQDGIDLVTGPRAEFLRACEAVDCGMLYLDQSQAQNRRWCSMRDCGNRAKVAAHRSRRRAETR